MKGIVRESPNDIERSEWHWETSNDIEECGMSLAFKLFWFFFDFIYAPHFYTHPNISTTFLYHKQPAESRRPDLGVRRLSWKPVFSILKSLIISTERLSPPNLSGRSIRSIRSIRPRSRAANCAGLRELFKSLWRSLSRWRSLFEKSTREFHLRSSSEAVDWGVHLSRSV